MDEYERSGELKPSNAKSEKSLKMFEIVRMQKMLTCYHGAKVKSYFTEQRMHFLILPGMT